MALTKGGSTESKPKEPVPFKSVPLPDYAKVGGGHFEFVVPETDD